ncbi:hypothetical protein [Deinococcus koreensis]|uniref:Uncharacterized protein n=1 Tax=Deinococcus koreensis TaxID=2054903 RepID=A0A2K3UZB3_9DEIO|nr:hypothetical protein [Deinococcus koreensis]PNY81863.1 hypothetical protein CVO96_11185 [Deinococcus koreensis]
MLPARPHTPPDWSAQRFLNAFLSRAPLILGGAALLTLGTYASLARQPPQYQAVSSLMAAPGETADSVVTTAPALPSGAVEQALHSQSLVQDMIIRLRRSGLDADTVARLSADLRRELSEQDFARLGVRAQLNDQQGGTYIVAARGGSPQEAKVLADTAVDALLAWDQARAVQSVTRLQRSLRSYLASVDRRLAATPDIGRRQALLQARQGASDRLAQLEQVQEAASGTLSPLASAVAPARPVSASPLRRTVLTFVLATLLGTVLAALWPTGRARGRGRPLRGVPELGWLPRFGPTELHLNQSAAQPIASWPASLRRAVSLLRSNLLAQLPPGTRRVVLTAPRPTTDQSTVTALLACSLAETGQRVLLIDAQPHPAQAQLWNVEPRWQPLSGASDKAPPASTLAEALLAPEGARARNVAPGIDLLGGPDTPRAAFALAQVEQLDLLLSRWGEAYDTVLIDAPALSVSQDAALLGGGRRSLLLLVDDTENRGGTLGTVPDAVPDSAAGVLGVVWSNVSQTWLGALAARSRGQEPALRRAAADSEGL